MSSDESTYRKVGKIGGMGYKCPCCGPRRRYKKSFRRLVRARLKEMYRKREKYER